MLRHFNKAGMKMIHTQAIFLVGMTLLLLGNVQSAKATQCTNDTLKGTYIFGFVGVTIDEEGNVKQAAYAGREIYKGDGTFTGLQSGSENGAVFRNGEYTGTYTVNPDCTAAVEITLSTGVVTKYDYFMAPSGEFFTWVEVDEGTVFAGSTTRVSHRIKLGDK
jgi:hypothetical protein